MKQGITHNVIKEVTFPPNLTFQEFIKRIEQLGLIIFCIIIQLPSYIIMFSLTLNYGELHDKMTKGI